MSFPLLGSAPPTGFAVAISPFSCFTLDIIPPPSYAEKLAPPHQIVEDVALPASHTGGTAPDELLAYWPMLAEGRLNRLSKILS